MKKKWYNSKTVRANIVAVAVILAQYLAGKFVIDPELQGVILAVANILLRGMTTEPITLPGAKSDDQGGEV